MCAFEKPCTLLGICDSMYGYQNWCSILVAIQFRSLSYSTGINEEGQPFMRWNVVIKIVLGFSNDQSRNTTFLIKMSSHFIRNPAYAMFDVSSFVKRGTRERSSLP
mmetsp:Transcript_9841/g.24529  ORF Transcript_9841/g.24529 Transcript_9841/m.24529 type:complete len:106 (-) Transcript_9841:1172-1489(-)